MTLKSLANASDTIFITGRGECHCEYEGGYEKWGFHYLTVTEVVSNGRRGAIEN